jgi:hypothetical protein
MKVTALLEQNKKEKGKKGFSCVRSTAVTECSEKNNIELRWKE